MRMRRNQLLRIVLILGTACAHGRAKVEFTPIPAAEAAAVKNPHDHGGKPLCQRCHDPGEAGPRVDPIELCSDCHDITRMRHPFGSEYLREHGTLPLYRGEIVCHTCHDPHDVKKHRHGLRDEYSPLCLNCHKRH
jgi:predicted CXXCH cytochrome family protein